MTDLFPVSIDDAISEINRELEFRRRVYPRLIESKKLTREKAEMQNARLRKALELLIHNKGKLSGE